jgi:tripartite-type tricarboxylate transporter receptor subunit TctC
MTLAHTFTKRKLLIASAAALTLLSINNGALAQAWPTKPIKLIVPFPPGGLIDNMARIIAPRLAAELGQAVVVDNKAGAGGGLGAAEAARAAPDGYTILMASPPLTISPALYASLPYKPEQIVPVALIGQVPNVLIVNPKSGLNSVADVIARAKKNPGKMNYASNGNGTSLHLSAELLKSLSGSYITHIPYRGAAAAVTGLLGGETDFMFENLPSVLGQINGGSVKALAVTTKQRSKVLPNVPSLAQSGAALGLADFNVSAWFGLAAPVGLPLAVAKRLEQAMEKISKEAEVVRVMESRGADVEFMNAAQMAQFMSADAAKWKRVAAYAKISLE